MRLIDADTLVKDLSYLYTKNHIPVDMRVKEILTTIMEQPTAYSVDKVVGELESEKSIHTENYNISIYKDYPEIKQRYKQVCGVIDKAIEIVKHGCVANNVCEWEKGSSGYIGYPAYYSKCCTTNSKGLEMQTHIISDWKYCPYCGKKIKVVE